MIYSFRKDGVTPIKKRKLPEQHLVEVEKGYNKILPSSNVWLKVITDISSTSQEFTNRICTDATAWCQWQISYLPRGSMFARWYNDDMTNIIHRNFEAGTNEGPGINLNRVYEYAEHWYNLPPDKKRPHLVSLNSYRIK